MSLSRCGRRYPDLMAAVNAAELIVLKGGKPREVTECPYGRHWHVRLKGTMLRSYREARPDPFPPPVAALLDARDEVCQRCGYTGRLERHHRRAKASGGSKARSHTQCACNGVRLCRRCHEWVHLNPRLARADGLIVLQSVAKPGEVGIAIFWRLTGLAYLTCEGNYAEASN